MKQNLIKYGLFKVRLGPIKLQFVGLRRKLNLPHSTPLFCTCTHVLATKNVERSETYAWSLFCTCAHVTIDKIYPILYFAHVCRQ